LAFQLGFVCTLTKTKDLRRC